jgi:DNA polymerase-3 subunit epsilon
MSMNDDLLICDAVFSVVDTETTGIAQRCNELVEIAAVRVRGLEIREDEIFQSLINPGMPIPPAVSCIHGITDEMVADAPPLQEVLEKYTEFCADTILVMQNASFDLSFLRPRLAAAGLPAPKNPVLDTMRLSRRIHPYAKSHGLDAILRRLNIVPRQRHRALGDALATAEALVFFLRKLMDDGYRSISQIVHSCFTGDKNGGSTSYNPRGGIQDHGVNHPPPLQ